MALFTEKSLNSDMVRDPKKLKTYLMQMNEDLRYMFNNLTPEENFSPFGVDDYLELDGYSTEFLKTADEFRIEYEDSEKEIRTGISQALHEISLYVSSGDVTNQINLSKDEILIEGQRLNVKTDNFSLDTEGNLDFKGTVIATGGKIGGFEIIKDSSGKQMLKGDAESSLTAGVIMGSVGRFKKFICRKEISMAGQTWTMYGCDIQSEGLTFTAGFSSGNVDIARYSENRGEYTSWYPLTCKKTIHATSGCDVGKNGDSSGKVRCLSVYSYFEGDEKPSPDGEEDSDRRLKDTLKPIRGKEALLFLRKLRPVEYTMRDDDLPQLGLIAQEVKAAQEEAGRDFGIVSDDGEYFSLNYMALIPIMAAALKETGRMLCQYSKKQDFRD